MAMAFDILPLTPLTPESPPNIATFSLAFDQLPIEINEHIASFLDDDQDLINFRLTCNATNDALAHPSCAIWRNRYARRYDALPGLSASIARLTYMIRTRILRQLKPFFYVGHETREIISMQKLRDLVVESYAGVPIGHKGEVSHNIEEIHRYIVKSNFLDKVLSPIYHRLDINPLMLTLQVIFTHWQLDLSIGFRTLGFGYSKHAVYAHPEDSPLFFDDDCLKVNMKFLLHIVNFFKYHLTTPEATTLHSAYRQLEDEQKPRAWDGPLQQGPGIMGVKKLGMHWKGSYSYLEPQAMARIRSLDPNEACGPIDNIDIDDGFQTLDLDFSHQANTSSWPRAFENHLHSLPTNILCQKLQDISKPHQTNNRTQPVIINLESEDTGLETPPQSPGAGLGQQFVTLLPRAASDLPPTPTSPPPLLSPKKGHNYLQFSGSGMDAERFECSGILHPLPPQEEIPGWQRITIMKYFPSGKPKKTQPKSSHHSPTTSAGECFTFDDDTDVDGSCWCYEGVVLPGGMIMVGRWWSPMDDSDDMECTGPFIFWNVASNEVTEA